MNEIIILTTLGERIPAKVTDEQLKNYREHGIKFELIGKVEKPEVLKQKKEE